MEIAHHKGKVWQVSVHPQLPLFASVSSDKTAQISSTKDFQMLRELKDIHERSIRSIGWRQNQPMLALGSFDSTMSIFGLEEPSWEFLAQLEGHDNEIKRVAWSADGNYLASCSRDKSVWIWEVDEGGEDFECVAVLQEHTQDVKHVVWHPSQEILASTSYDDSIRLWRRDDDEWICVAHLDGPDGHASTVWSADFDHNSMSLVSCSADLKVKIWTRLGQSGGSGEGEKLPSVARWDVLSEEWKLETELPSVHDYAIYSVKWGKNGKIATTGADGKIVIYHKLDQEWKIQQVIERAHGIYEVNSVDWLGEQIVSGGDDGNVKLWTLS